MNDDKSILNEQGAEGTPGPEAATFHAPVIKEQEVGGASRESIKESAAISSEVDKARLEQTRDKLERVSPPSRYPSLVDRVIMGGSDGPRWKYVDESRVRKRTPEENAEEKRASNEYQAKQPEKSILQRVKNVGAAWLKAANSGAGGIH